MGDRRSYISRLFVASLILLRCRTAICQDTNAYEIYQVGVGESLSDILYYKFHLSPVYGPNGFIQKVVHYNSGKIYQNGDLILPGELIWVPKVGARDVAAAAPAVIAPPAIQTPIESVKVVAEPTPAPSPSVTPDPVAAVLSPAPEFVRHSKVSAVVGLSYLGVTGLQKSNQTTGHLTSDLSPSVELAWSQVWREDLKSRIFVGAQSIQFESDATGTTIANSTLFSTLLGLGAAWNVTRILSLSADVEDAQTLFYIGNASGGIKVEQAPIVRLHPKLKIVLVNLSPFRLSLLGGYSYYGASSYDTYSIQSGNGFDGALEISQSLKNSDLFCQAGYLERHQDTTYLSLTEQRLSLACGLGWGL